MKELPSMEDREMERARRIAEAEPLTHAERVHAIRDAEYFSQFGSEQGFSTKKDGKSFLRLAANLRDTEAELAAYKAFFLTWLNEKPLDREIHYYNGAYTFKRHHAFAEALQNIKALPVSMAENDLGFVVVNNPCETCVSWLDDESLRSSERCIHHARYPRGWTWHSCKYWESKG